MNGFGRYVFRQLAVGMIMVTIGLTSVIWLTQSLRFIEMIVNRGLTAGSFLYLTMLLLPNFLSIILPIALFTVVVFVYSKLISDRELVIMRASGVSQAALAWPALALSVIVVVLGYVLNLYLLPQSYRMFREMQWDIRYSYSQVMLQEGAFTSVSEGITVYVRERAADGQLRGILVHDKRRPNAPYTLMAERGALVDSGGGGRVVMFNGNRQEVDPTTHQLSILYFDRYVVELGQSKEADVERYREARERTLDELLRLAPNDLENVKDYKKFKVEAHKRLTAPLAALGYALIGLACLISGNFSRRLQNGRIVVAVAVIVALQALTLGLENLSAANLSLLPLMYVNVLLPTVLGYAFMVRARRFRRLRGAIEAA